MLILSVFFRAPPDQAEVLRPHMQTVIAASRAEPGCLFYTLAEDIADKEGNVIVADGTLLDEPAVKAIEEAGGKVVAAAALVDRSNGSADLGVPFFPLIRLTVPTYSPDTLPLMLELSAIFTLVTFLIFALYGLLAAQMREHVISKPNVLIWMRRSFAAAFVGLGAKLALAER